MRDLSNKLLAEFYGQESSDPLLTLFTLSDPSFSTIYLVNNSEEIVSNGNTFLPFPVSITLPTDDGESRKEVQIEFDNVSLELIGQLRAVKNPIECNLAMILASSPDDIEIELDELKIRNIKYDSNTIKATLYMDDFMNTEMTSEKYGPSNFPGIF